MWYAIILITYATALTAATIIKNEERYAQLTTEIQDDNKIDNESSSDVKGSSLDLEESLGRLFKLDDAQLRFPAIGSTVFLDTKNLDNDELNIKLDFGSSVSGGEARKKSKIKKVLIPILVLVLLKAIILIPLALGILGIKTWNAIQLSFVSFVSAVVLAIWKLCSKINSDQPPAIIHSGWDPHHHHHHLDRSDVAQSAAYSAYAPSS